MIKYLVWDDRTLLFYIFIIFHGITLPQSNDKTKIADLQPWASGSSDVGLCNAETLSYT